jgi:hypothetical protein
MTDTIHVLAESDANAPSYVWLDGDGDLHHLGEFADVCSLYDALGALVVDGRCHPDAISETDLRWGNAYRIADAVRVALAAGHDGPPSRVADTIRAAARRGAIAGATRAGGAWEFPPGTLWKWVREAKGETRGRPRKENGA